MRTPACLLLTLTVVAAAPQPTPTPPQSSSPSPHQHTLASLFTNCIELDISEIEELWWKLNNTIDFDLTGEKNMISFGLLEEDWFRLKLLEDRLPVDSLLKPKLLKLFRLVISAIFQAHKPSVQIAETNHTLFETTQLNRTELDPPNISDNLLKPTTVNQSNVLSMPTTITDGIDNVAAESEPQESVLPFNTFASPFEIETTTTLHSKDTDLKFNFDKGSESSTFSNFEGRITQSTVVDETTGMSNEATSTPETSKNPIEDAEKDHGTSYDETTGMSNEVTSTPETSKNPIEDAEKDHGTSYDETTGMSNEATSTPETSKNPIEDAEKDHGTSYDETTGMSNEATSTPETNKNPIEDAEKDHGTSYDETESRGGVSEVNNNVDNYSPNTVSSETSLSRDSTIQPSPSQDDTSQHQHASNPIDSSSSTERPVDNNDQSINTISYSDHPNYSTTTLSNSTSFNDTTNDIYNDSPSPIDLTSTSENNFREDDSLHSTTFSPFSSTSSRSMKTSWNKTVTETSHSFTTVSPVYSKLTSPAIKVNTLKIYPPDRSKILIFPFEGPRVPPMMQAVCKNKNTCVKVQNIKFNNPKNHGRYTEPNSDTSSEDVRFYKMEVESNRKSWDSENILWWHKVRNLRKKTADR